MARHIRFQSTLPVWGGTAAPPPASPPLLCFNPPSPCGEGPGCAPLPSAHMAVSIHPPRVGRDLPSFLLYHRLPLFQSTLPVWGGTVAVPFPSISQLRFNPPSPCGEGPLKSPLCYFLCGFNPPSPCGEGLLFLL